MAMDMQKAVVAFQTGDVETLITDNENGVLVPLNDIFTMSHRLKELLATPARIQQLGQRAHATIQTGYDFKTTVAQIEKIFLELYLRKTGGEYGAQNPGFSG